MPAKKMVPTSWISILNLRAQLTTMQIDLYSPTDGEPYFFNTPHRFFTPPVWNFKRTWRKQPILMKSWLLMIHTSPKCYRDVSSMRKLAWSGRRSSRFSTWHWYIRGDGMLGFTHSGMVWVVNSLEWEHWKGKSRYTQTTVRSKIYSPSLTEKTLPNHQKDSLSIFNLAIIK